MHYNPAMTGQHATMNPAMMTAMGTYPPGSLPPLSQPPVDRSNSVAWVAGLAIIVLGLFGYFLLFGNPNQQQPLVAGNPAGQDDTARLREVLARSDGLIDRKQYSQAQIILDNGAADFARYPELMVEVAERKDRIEIGRLLESGRTYEETGDREAALRAYREILSRNGEHAEARERVSALSGAAPEATLGWLAAISVPSGGAVYVDDAAQPIGVTPLDPQPLPVGVHQITILLDDHLPWKKTVTIAANKNFPINAELTPMRAGATTRPTTRPTTKPTAKPTAKPEGSPKPDTTSKPPPQKPTAKPVSDDDGLMPVGKKK